VFACETQPTFLGIKEADMATTDTPHSPVFRTLVVDDSEPWRQHILSILQTQPELRVVADTADGLEAVQKAKELQPDLILLDIGLPNLNGLEAANRIRQVAADAKILFLTLNSDQDVVRAALNTGAQGYVLKTDAGRELLPAVAGVLGGDDFVSSGIKGADSGETERQVNAPPTLNEKTQSPVAT
jgi:DNA-binding NarL/FixJ family response regulator